MTETRLVRGLWIILKVVQKHASREKKTEGEHDCYLQISEGLLSKRNAIFIMSTPASRLLCVCCCVWLSVTPWTVARQAPLSTGFSRQEHWSGTPFPPPGDLLTPGIEPTSFASFELAVGLLTTAPPGKLGLSPEGGKRPTIAAVPK